jgi:hypothetical protein
MLSFARIGSKSVPKWCAKIMQHDYIWQELQAKLKIHVFKHIHMDLSTWTTWGLVQASGHHLLIRLFGLS